MPWKFIRRMAIPGQGWIVVMSCLGSSHLYPAHPSLSSYQGQNALKSAASFCLGNDPGFSGRHVLCSVIWPIFPFQPDPSCTKETLQHIKLMYVPFLNKFCSLPPSCSPLCIASSSLLTSLNLIHRMEYPKVVPQSLHQGCISMFYLLYIL